METDHELLADIDGRLRVVENEITNIKKLRGTVWQMGSGLAFLLIGMIVTGLIGWGQLMERVGQIPTEKVHKLAAVNLQAIELNIATALEVLKKHGHDMTKIRDEQLRVRTKIDSQDTHFLEINKRMDLRTADRFYRQDGEKLEKRIERLEDAVFFDKE